MKKDITSERKKDHIELAFQSQISQLQTDKRFFYEPMLNSHPVENELEFDFLGYKFGFPIWISSMTGGTKKARLINENLAKACGEFKLGMGLGSCRIILNDNLHLPDFDFRNLVGDQPFYANLGIAQVEELTWNFKTDKIVELINKLQANGLIIHVNPFQEWLQPEGDRIQRSPVETITKLMESVTFPIIVKEVGQGMGPQSLSKLLQLPLKAIEFAAHGGTNFSKLEMLRADENFQNIYGNLALVGHTADEMVNMVNSLIEELGTKVKCKNVIISGGIKNFLDGYYLVEKINCNAVYGQASALLKHAEVSYEKLAEYIETQKKGYELASYFLKIK